MTRLRIKVREVANLPLPWVVMFWLPGADESHSLCFATEEEAQVFATRFAGVARTPPKLAPARQPRRRSG